MQYWIAVFFVWAAAAQSQNTTLIVRVGPEGRVSPPQVTLNFVVSPDTSAAITSRTVFVSAWVRATPGQSIRLTATQSGALPISWTGATGSATGGGRQASCTNGSFDSGPVQDLAANWRASGTLSCSLTFYLANPPSLVPGPYSATVTFSAQ